MKYVVIEIQTNNDNVSTIVNQYDTLPLAESAYHQVLSFAAVSNVEWHGAMLMNSQGSVYRNDMFTHLAE